jgi:hypothetical protein
MKSEALKKVVAIAGILGMFAAATSYAQAPDYTPTGTVNEQGQLVIGDQVIDPPQGTVDGSGNLVLPSGTITKPVATVLGDGSLQVGDQIYPVPTPPATGLISWLGEDNVAALTELVNGAAWYFSYNFKSIYHFGNAGQNWIWSERFGGVYLAVALDSGSAASGFWAYSYGFPEIGVNAWIYIFRNDNATGGSFRDLRLEPENPTFPGSTSRKRMTGYVYTSNGAKYFFFTENSAQTMSFVTLIGGDGSFIQVWPR